MKVWAKPELWLVIVAVALTLAGCGGGGMKPPGVETVPPPPPPKVEVFTTPLKEGWWIVNISTVPTSTMVIIRTGEGSTIFVFESGEARVDLPDGRYEIEVRWEDGNTLSKTLKLPPP